MPGRKHEERKVLTLCGDRGWHDPNQDKFNAASAVQYTAASVLRGYRHLNKRINRLAQKVTIHSVSYSEILLPYPGSAAQLRLLVTVVYSGELDIIDEFGEIDSSTGNPRQDDETVFFLML